MRFTLRILTFFVVIPALVNCSAPPYSNGPHSIQTKRPCEDALGTCSAEHMITHGARAVLENVVGEAMSKSPVQSDIQNVLAMNKPQHMLSKLLWEIFHMTNSMSVHEDNGQFPEQIFWAFNCAVTAWHITDWLWQSDAETRAILSDRFKLNYQEGSTSARRRGLNDFRKQSRRIVGRCTFVARLLTVRSTCARTSLIPTSRLLLAGMRSSKGLDLLYRETS